MVFFEPMTPDSPENAVYAAIRDAILSGKLEAGDRIAEATAARAFQVSRMVVREAVDRLAREGLVERHPRRGTRVVELSPAQVDDLVSIRLVLEAEAARRACLNLQEADRAALAGLAERITQAEQDRLLFARLSLELHETIWRLSGSEKLHKMLRELTLPLFALDVILHKSEGADWKELVNVFPADHSRLVSALLGGDPEAAAAAMRSHIAGSWAHLRESVEELAARRTAGSS